MKELLTYIIPPIITLLFGWFLARRQKNAEAKVTELEAEMKAAEFYRSLLDDAKLRIDDSQRQLNEAIKAIHERDARIKERDKKIELLIEEIELLTGEIRKYKQLNGKKE